MNDLPAGHDTGRHAQCQKLASSYVRNDYDLFKSPLADFQAEVRAAGLEGRVHYLSHGETYDFAVVDAGAPTWQPLGGGEAR